jgi:hypothetical protein
MSFILYAYTNFQQENSPWGGFYERARIDQVPGYIQLISDVTWDEQPIDQDHIYIYIYTLHITPIQNQQLCGCRKKI